MVPIPAGSVTLETPDGPEKMSVGPLWISKTEVPWEIYDVFVYGLEGGTNEDVSEDAVSRPSKPYVLPGEDFGHQGYPALGATYEAANNFTQWLSLKTDRNYRLATGPEWMYVCAAGQTEEQLDDYAWHEGNANQQTHPVGSSEPDRMGVQDMLGNVAEWTTPADPEASEPVVRGGSYQDAVEDVHCGATKSKTPAWQATDPQLPRSESWLSDAPFVGFRLVRVPEEGTSE